MSETASRFRRKKPVITASVAIAEHFQAMDAEHADHMARMAMLADLDCDFPGRFVTPYFFAEDDPQFERWYQNTHRSRNTLTVEMLYAEDDAYREEQEARKEHQRACSYDYERDAEFYRAGERY